MSVSLEFSIALVFLVVILSLFPVVSSLSVFSRYPANSFPVFVYLLPPQSCPISVWSVCVLSPWVCLLSCPVVFSLPVSMCISLSFIPLFPQTVKSPCLFSPSPNAKFTCLSLGVCVCYLLFYFDSLVFYVCNVHFCLPIHISYDLVQLCAHVFPLLLINLLCTYCLHLPLFGVAFFTSLCVWLLSIQLIVNQ